MKVKDLPTLTDTPHPRPFAYCPECGAEWSADRGDYFLMVDEDTFDCGRCGAELELVTRETVHKPWKGPKGGRG